MKYFFQTISWNAYLTIVSLCKLPRNVHDILFETFHETDFQNFLYHERLYYWICFHDWLTLCCQWRLQRFKRKCKYYVKSKQSGFRYFEKQSSSGVLSKRFLKKTLAQVFSCEFCEISKNTFFIEHLWWLFLYFIIQNLKNTEDRLE